MMSVFTLMGFNIMRQNDAYSFHRIMMIFDVLFLGAPVTQHDVSVYVHGSQHYETR